MLRFKAGLSRILVEKLSFRENVLVAVQTSGKAWEAVASEKCCVFWRSCIQGRKMARGMQSIRDFGEMCRVKRRADLLNAV